MNYYYSKRMNLKGNHTIVVDIRPASPQEQCRAFFMNSDQIRQFISSDGVISADWMPLDHVAELTDSKPIVQFEVSGKNEWMVVIERAAPPIIALDSGNDLIG